MEAETVMEEVLEEAIAVVMIAPLKLVVAITQLGTLTGESVAIPHVAEISLLPPRILFVVQVIFYC